MTVSFPFSHELSNFLNIFLQSCNEQCKPCKLKIERFLQLTVRFVRGSFVALDSDGVCTIHIGGRKFGLVEIETNWGSWDNKVVEELRNWKKIWAFKSQSFFAHYSPGKRLTIIVSLFWNDGATLRPNDACDSLLLLLLDRMVWVLYIVYRRLILPKINKPDCQIDQYARG